VVNRSCTGYLVEFICMVSRQMYGWFSRWVVKVSRCMHVVIWKRNSKSVCGKKTGNQYTE
jgi:hypothetical protein